MKYGNITPTSVERVMREDDFLVSKTDPKGRITYGNRIFIEFSGYTESELLGSQHNLVRHPDMPRGVFHLLWGLLSKKQECFAYVKNLCKDGSYYWVLANVTPSLNAQGELEGYFSVRRKPKPQAVALISDLYQKMLAEEKRVGSRDACDASLALLNGVVAQKGVDYESFILSI